MFTEPASILVYVNVYLFDSVSPLYVRKPITHR